jgi:hypothetical protein
LTCIPTLCPGRSHEVPTQDRVIAATAATLLSLTLPAHAAPQITPDDCFRGGGPDRYKRDM